MDATLDPAGAPHEQVTVDLGPSIDSAGVARAVVREHLAGVPDDVVETACLLAGELVANVLLHVATPSRLIVTRTPTQVRVEVSDHSPEPPAPRSTRLQDLTGRGLRIIDELAEAWGTIRHPGDGKTVWFTLSLAMPEHA